MEETTVRVEKIVISTGKLDFTIIGDVKVQIFPDMLYLTIDGVVANSWQIAKFISQHDHVVAELTTIDCVIRKCNFKSG